MEKMMGSYYVQALVYDHFLSRLTLLTFEMLHKQGLLQSLHSERLNNLTTIMQPQRASDPGCLAMLFIDVVLRQVICNLSFYCPHEETKKNMFYSLSFMMIAFVAPVLIYLEISI
jgi:hypothetical protein